jgi:DNA-directed RNA polymerase subunit L
MISIYKTNPIDCTIEIYKEQSFLNNLLKSYLRKKDKKKFSFVYPYMQGNKMDIIGIK